MKYLLLPLIILFTGCATISHGTTQTVKLLNVPDTGCIVNGFTVSPYHSTQDYTVTRGKNDLVFICGDRQLTVESSVTTAGATSIALVDFGLVDSISGALWGYPDEINLADAK